MVTINRIYTKTGDDGTSALDELNTQIGMARLAAMPAELDGMLGTIQNDLFDLGADLATPDGARGERLRVVVSQVERLEREIDRLNTRVGPLTSFVLPGGSPAAAALHVCRAVARRAERTVVELAARETLNPEAVHFINRLSDFLFVAARVANDDGRRDVLWVPGQNR